MARLKRVIFGLLCTGAAAAYALPGAPMPVKTSTEKAGQYWSYQAIQAQVPPTVRNTAWPHNDIDRFILARLEARGVQPAVDADPATLVRRVYFDLIGLPPSPEQIDSYLKDAGPDRYERLVDRLLASPDFGQRWGRHWLDVARFGESLTLRGFILKDAWRYRDYVIESFNVDRPFDRFMQEQVAGDLLPAPSYEDRRRQIVATAFLAIGNHNLEEQDKKQLEMDVVDEQINAISTAFLGQTIGCARCHDHKFDPISTRDYYALAGILKSTQTLEHANVSKWLEIPLPTDPAREEVLKKHESEIAALQAKLTAEKLAVASGPQTGKPTIIAIADLPGIVVDDSQSKHVGTWKKSVSTRTYIGDGYATDNNDHSEPKSLTFQPEIPENGKYEVRFAYTAGPNRASNVTVTVFSADGSETIKVDERVTPPIAGHFLSLGQHTFEKSGQGFVLISNDGADGYVIADAVQFIPLETTSSAQAGAAAKPNRIKITSEPIKKLEAQIKKMTEEGPKRDVIDSIREAKLVADVPVHMRGNVHTLGDMVPRGFVKIIATDHPPVIPKDQSGRRELGQWLSDPQNPLPARVMANRIWHWTFGAGIVRTVDNFGTTGETPSHPELLDYLATQFTASHWSVKALVRQIVVSHAYRLSTTSSASAQSLDPENRLMSHMNRRRLDAECIRDEMLSVSGQLTACPGGPTYKSDVKSDFGYKQTATIRSVYLPAFRNSMPELFEVFDVADPSVSQGRRNVSTVAPQSLFMLNSPFVIEQSRLAAKRLLDEKDLASDEAKLDRAYELTLSRPPTKNERQMMLGFVRESSGEKPQAWAQVFHALFASVDFRYVN